MQGNVLQKKYNLSDISYNGIVSGSALSAGQGVLTDHELASDNYEDNNGHGWIGWQATKSPNPHITFTFIEPRIFSSVTFHCNVRTLTKVELFSAVSVGFSLNGTSYDTLERYEPPDVNSAHGWLSYNVTINLCGQTAKFVQIRFEYRGDWILLSEVIFVTGMRLNLFLECLCMLRCFSFYVRQSNGEFEVVVCTLSYAFRVCVKHDRLHLRIHFKAVQRKFFFFMFKSNLRFLGLGISL